MNDARLGDFLAKLGVVSTQQLHTAREAQAANGGRLASVLVNMGCVTEEELARLAATALRLPYVALEKVVVPKDLVALLPKQHAKKCKGILVKKEGKRFLLATCDPTNFQAFDDLQFVLGGSVSPVVAAEIEIIRALGHYYGERVIPDRPFDLPKSDALSYDRPEVFDIKAARAKKQQASRRVDSAPSLAEANRKAAQDRLSAVASTVVSKARAEAAAAPAQRAPAAMPIKDAPQAAPAPRPGGAGLPPLRDEAELRRPAPAPAPVQDEPEDLEVLELEDEQPAPAVTGRFETEDAFIGAPDDETVELGVVDDEPLAPEAVEAASQSAADDLIAMFAAAAFGIDPATMNKPKEKNEDADALAALLGGMLGGGPSAPKADEAPAPAEPNELAKELAHLLLDQTEFTA